MVKTETSKHFSAPTVDPERVLHYGELSKTWWKTDSIWFILHSVNRLRIPWTVDTLAETGVISMEKSKSSKPLEGVHILDVGCGGGFAAEPFAELGGTVVGIDPAAELIDKAKDRQTQNPLLKNVTYICGTIDDHVEKNREKYDVLFISQVLVHVKDPDLFLQLCIECLKPGGHVFVTTLNKTWSAWFLYIVLYEHVFKIIPFGTHRYDIFIQPSNVENWLNKYNCRTSTIRGYFYNHFYKGYDWSRSTSIEYALHAIKDNR